MTIDVKSAAAEMAKAMECIVSNPDLKVLETEAMKTFPQAPILRPVFNIGGLEDIPTGKIVTGVRGESIIWGGFAHVNSVTGGGNCYKSEQLLEWFCGVLGRYLSSRGIFYDTENTMTYDRIERGLHKFPITEFYDAFSDSLLPADERKITFVQGADLDGDQFVENLRTLSRERVKNKRGAHPKGMVTVPVKQPNGDLMTMSMPIISMIDSLSMFTTASVMQKTVESNKIGDKSNNTIFMKDGASKTQMFIQLPGITTNGDIFVGMVAHLGHYIEMDQYAPKPMKLTFQRHGTKLKGVPEKFSFINNLVEEVHSIGKLINKDKTPLYPATDADKQSGNDLMQINAFTTRNKAGASGVELNKVVSQKEGIKDALTRFNYIKAFGRPGFGLSGNDQNYTCDLYPEPKLSRTTVRNKLANDKLLARAVGVTCQLLQMQLLWNIEPKYYLSPQDIKSKIEARGYDISELLNTREYWIFIEDEKYDTMPFLSTWDFLRIAVGEYHPYWMKDIPSKNPDKDKLQAQREQIFKDNIKGNKDLEATVAM